MTQYFHIERDQDIALVTFKRDDLDMNVLSEPVIRELDRVLDQLTDDHSIKGVVFLSGRDNQFIVGADINEFAKFKSAEEAASGAAALQAVFQKISTLPFPSVAAIHGQCLGGGVEMALACTWRVVTDASETRLGFPEIQLGLIPGAGGTQRLPRLIGIQAALDLILTGKRVNGSKAARLGLADVAVPMQLLRQEAVKIARKTRQPPRRFPGFDNKDFPRWAIDGNPLGRGVMRKKAREMVESKTKGFYPASYKALDAVFDGFDQKLEQGLELEAKIFGQLAMTRESKSLIHLFHATTAIKKHPYKAAGIERFHDKKTKLIGVVGSGFMGMGIATVAVDKGIRVRLSDPNKDAIGKALKHVRGFFEKKLERKRIKPFEVDAKMTMVSPSSMPVGFGKCDIVIEAVFEDLALKRKILAELEGGAEGQDDWIFASNTSAIPIKELANVAKKPERVLGMHFFSPVEKMPLLEVVVTDQTADWATARAIELGQTLGKQVIVVKDSPGFYTTRALAFFLNEAALMLAQGCKTEVIDTALTDFGFPVGPITLIDEVGIDVGVHVLETVGSAFPERLKMPDGVREIQESGRLGRKNQKGFYHYVDGKKGRADTGVYKLITSESSTNNITEDEIIDRCLLLFVNESVRCLEEGILANAYDGDVGAVFGLGFPPFWGGPFRYVDHVGAMTIVDRLKGLQDKYGERFRPAELLVEHAQSNKLFFPDEG